VKYITNQNHKNTNKNQKHNERRKLSTSSLSKNNDRFIKNLSKANLTDNQIKLLSKGLKFIPTATVTKNKKKAPTLARLQRFHKANALEIHFSRAKQINTSLLCQIKLGTAIQPSVTLETHLEEIKQKTKLVRQRT